MRQERTPSALEQPIRFEDMSENLGIAPQIMKGWAEAANSCLLVAVSACTA